MASEERKDKKIKLTDLFESNDDAIARPRDSEKKMEPNNNLVANENAASRLTSMDTIDEQNFRSDDPTTSSGLPAVFQTENLTYDERWNIVCWDILPDRKPFEVEQAFFYYIESNVELDQNWEAIWRSHQLMGDILVQVTEVQAEDQRAKVELVVPFCCESSSGRSISQQEVERVLETSKGRVSLLELFPVYDESGDLDNTAMALEHLRFFYDYIWRLSDENDDGDYIYAMRHLEQRMKMYYDVKNKTLSASIADKYTEAMTEYQQKYWQLKLKRAQFDPDSDADDEDEDGPEIPEAEMVEMTELCDELDVLMKTLEKLEDPVMRAIVMKGSAKKKDKKKRSSEDRHSRPNQEVFTHLVAEKLTMGMIKNLSLKDDAVIVQHSGLLSALDSCYNGDTILLYPGTYSGEGFYNLTQSVHIKGVGKSASDVVILCQEKVSIFVDCTAYKLHLSNMSFESEIQDSPNFAALDVRSGTTTLSNCVFKSLCQPIMVSKEGSLLMDQCEIHGFLSPGIQVMAGGTLSLSNSHIHHCGQSNTNTENQMGLGLGSNNLLIEADEGAEGLDQTTITMHDNKIVDSNGSGICITIFSAKLTDIPKPINVASDNEIASLLPSGIKWETKDNTFTNNKDGNICVMHVGKTSMENMDTSF
ncbi:SHC SH2 domain-binding protein 1 homolog B-like [Amphiura filiformis]|uniref:SHC SH2 domain-binding protein 1 homolog B-like n=1 Tax=Amphiura filiformis TaxID=82378 RepID=UPI003B213536